MFREEERLLQQLEVRSVGAERVAERKAREQAIRAEESRRRAIRQRANQEARAAEDHRYLEKMEMQRQHTERARLTIIEAAVAHEAAFLTTRVTHDIEKQGNVAAVSQSKSLVKHLARMRKVQLDKQKEKASAIHAAGKYAAQMAKMSTLDTSRQIASARREASQALAKRREQVDAEYLQKARANRERAQTWQLSARKSVRSSTRAKRQAAARARAEDVRSAVIETRYRILSDNRREVRCIYQSRFVSKPDEEQYDTNPLGKPVWSARLGDNANAFASQSASRMRGLIGGEEEGVEGAPAEGAPESAPEQLEGAPAGRRGRWRRKRRAKVQEHEHVSVEAGVESTEVAEGVEGAVEAQEPMEVGEEAAGDEGGEEEGEEEWEWEEEEEEAEGERGEEGELSSAPLSTVSGEGGGEEPSLMERAFNPVEMAEEPEGEADVEC